MSKDKDIIQSFIKLGCKCSNNGYYLYDIQKWLREEKCIDILIDASKNNGKSYYFKVRTCLTSGVEVFGDKFKTYEEALEAGIWEAYYLITN